MIAQSRTECTNDTWIIHISIQAVYNRIYTAICMDPEENMNTQKTYSVQ